MGNDDQSSKAPRVLNWKNLMKELDDIKSRLQELEKELVSFLAKK